jgi:hypothetical protein
MAEMTEFPDKLKYANEQHNKISWWYKENFRHYETIDHPVIQKEMDIDLLVVPHNDIGYFVEEKFIPKGPYKNLMIETIQNTKYSNNPGWIHISQAHILAWHYCPEDKDHTLTYWMNMWRLKDFYYKYGKKYRHQIKRTGACVNTHPQYCLVPWTDIMKHIGYKYYEIPYK